LILPGYTGAGFRRRGLLIDRSQDSFLPQATVRMKNELHELAQIYLNTEIPPACRVRLKAFYAGLPHGVALRCLCALCALCG
jgi:hypothetical protein